ncbi:MAG: hypothetical protein ISS25_01580 [Nanoarchaeota archaeon]|nr:hypothetical protein [DPANN group archaeon]MBL7116501.1 hypothetical protein [Nanoarchaeota archaeon]
MNFLARDFFISAGKATRKKTVKVKKGEEVDFLSFGTTDTKDDLRKELEKAENIYKKLKGKVTKKKLKEIGERMESLKSRLEEEDQEEMEDFIEHDGMMITAPIFEDLHDDLESLDEEFNIPKRDEIPEEPQTEEVGKPDAITPPERPSTKLLNLMPPPKK